MGKLMMNDQVMAGTTDAGQQFYDNSTSGLSATNVQDAIDEIINNQGEIDYDTEDKALVLPDGSLNYDTETQTITLLL